jgi:tetratricopeptide (TPR) repeat protein
MPEPEDIEAQRELLRVYRRNLALYLQQQAEQGGMAYVTPAVANGIVDARAEITQIKGILRGWGQAIDDHPNDMPASPPSPIASAPKRPHAGAQLAQAAPTPSTAVASTAAIDPDGLEAYFTDVEHLREAFRQLVSAPALPKRLLVLHGVGGAGKSSLLRMFRIYARRANIPIALASGDEVKSVVDILSSWSDDLQATGVRLPTTTKTLARYRSVQTTVERQVQKASTVAGKLAVKTAEGVAGSFAGAAIGSAFPVLGTIAGATVGALVGTGGEALSDWLSTFLKRPDIELVLDPTRQLTSAFLADLATAAAQQRVVLLLDTFEQISALEDWARDLAQRLNPNVLLVIAGRALPGWGRAWPGWLAQARVEELKPMTPAIMRALIGRYYATMHGGDPDPAQVEAIISFARGLPVVVTSAVQLWVAYGVEDFQSVKSQVVADLVDRLLEGVPRELVPMLEAAAALRWFNKDLLRALTQQNDVNSAYDELRRFSFIRPRSEGLVLHDTVRELIDENLRISDPERHHTLHERAVSYFESHLVHATGPTESLELERLYQCVRSDEEAGMRLFQEVVEELVHYQLVSRLRVLLNDAATYPLEQPNSRLWREYYRARLDYLESRLQDAERVYQTIGESNLAEPKLRAYALCDLGELFVRLERIGQPHSAQKALEILEESQKLAPRLDSKLVSVFSHLRDVYGFRGQWQVAVELLEKQLQFFEYDNNKYELLYALNSLKDIYGVIGDWRNALHSMKRGISIADEMTNGSPLRAKLTGRTLWAVIWSGRFSEAEQGIRAAMALAHQVGDVASLPSIATDLGLVLGLQGRFREALDHIEDAVQRYKQRNSKSFGLLAGIPGVLGVIFAKKGDLSTSEKHLTQSLAIKQSFQDSVGIPELETQGNCT